MLSIGLCVAGEFDGSTYRRNESFSDTFYMELKPTGTEIDPEALRVNGLDRGRLERDGVTPERAVRELTSWVRSISKDKTPILVAYPLSFDWPFVSWYFERFGERASPFGHSGCLDIRTFYVAKAHSRFSESSKSRIPEFLRPSRAHTHNALDDAKEQAELFSNIFEWKAKETTISV